MNQRLSRLRLAAFLALLAGLAPLPASAESWRSAEGLAWVDGGGSRLTVSCESGLLGPVVALEYKAPPPVVLQPTRYGVNRWNIGFSASRGGAPAGGSIHWFDPFVGEDGHWHYVGRSDSATLPPEDALVLVQSLMAADALQVSSTEVDAAGAFRPLFAETLSLDGAAEAIRRALAPGGCLDLLKRAAAALGSGD